MQELGVSRGTVRQRTATWRSRDGPSSSPARARSRPTRSRLAGRKSETADRGHVARFRACDGAARYGHHVDHEWAAERLTEFRDNIDALVNLKNIGELHDSTIDDLIGRFGTPDEIVDHLLTIDPVMRELMEAAKPKLGEYADSASSGYSRGSPDYWWTRVRPLVLNAIGIHTLGDEARKRMRPDSPDLAADQFHLWVWDAAAPLWEAGALKRPSSLQLDP